MDDVEWQVWCDMGQAENLLDGVSLESWWAGLEECRVRVQSTNWCGRWLRSLYIIADRVSDRRDHLGMEEHRSLLISKSLENLFNIQGGYGWELVDLALSVYEQMVGSIEYLHHSR